MDLNGGGFDIGGRYTIYWSKTGISTDSVPCDGEMTPSCYVVVGEGEFPRDTKQVSVSFTIPEASYGNNYVQYVRFGRDDTWGFPVFVVPDLTVTPLTSSPHTKVTINGTGFPAKNSNIKIILDGVDTKMDVATSQLGSFTGEFTIPETTAGNHELKAYDENISFGEITANLQVKPAISMDPVQPEAGSEATLTGWGFAARSKVSVKFDDKVVSNSPTTNENGNFVEKFLIPESSQNTHMVIAKDQAGNEATTAAIGPGPGPGNGNSMPSPNTISPVSQRFGWFGAQPVVFSWTEISDASGVTYEIEVARDLRFFPLEPGMRNTGLAEPNTVMTLGPGTYFWRVRALDGVGNESEWSVSPYPFRVGLVSGFYLFVGAIIFIIIFIVLVRVFFQRVRTYYR